MKKIFVILVFVSLLFLSSCSNEDEIINKKYYSTWSVFTWVLDLSNTFVWTVEWEEMVDLATKVWWRLTEVNFKQWDYVETWDIIARLDSSEAKVWYSSADSILASLYSMRESTISMFNEQIASMEAKVEQARIWEKSLNDWYDDTLIVSETSLDTAKTQVETAKANLDHTKLVLETKENHIYDNSKDAIVQAIILDTNIINFVDILLWVTDENEDKNDAFQDYLWAENKTYLNDAVIKFNSTYNLFLDFNNFYDLNIEWKNPSKEIILEWLFKWENLAEDLKVLLNLVYDVLDNSIENYNFSVELIWNYKNQISQFWNNIEASLVTVSWEYILWLKWSRQNLSDFEKSSLMQIELLEKQVELAEKTYAQYEASYNSQIRSIENQSKIWTSQLEEALAWLESLKKQKEVKIKEIDAQISQASWERNSAWVMIDSWIIKSPISWIITYKNAELWQVVWAWIPIFKVSSVEDLKLKIYVWEDLSKNLVIWDEVIVELDWINEQINWKITNIFSSSDFVTKRVWVEISFDNIWWKVKVWAYANVIFKNSNIENKVLISNKAIISKFMLPWVYVLENNKVIFKNIEIISQNESFSEVNWLNVWEIIILDWKENIWDWEELN